MQKVELSEKCKTQNTWKVFKDFGEIFVFVMYEWINEIFILNGLKKKVYIKWITKKKNQHNTE